MDYDLKKELKSDCENCFALCCVALPFAKSADFAFSKDGGTPCRNLQSDYRCGIHCSLREKGFKGCTVYECFGAGQKVSQITYDGKEWRGNPELAEEMFRVFPLMQQLHEMLYYLDEALGREEARPLCRDLIDLVEKTKSLTELDPVAILELDIPSHRKSVSKLLQQVSELIRNSSNHRKVPHNAEKNAREGRLIGASLQGKDLKGFDFRGALLIAANFQDADLRKIDFLGADLRDADISGANLQGSIFLTQAQINAAKGNLQTKIPNHLKAPQHWRD